MTWETKDVLFLVGSAAGIAVAWGVLQTRVTALARELESFRRDTRGSLTDQGRRVGELETAAKIAREISRYVGKGTPAWGTVFPPPPSPDRPRRPPDDSGQVAGQVEDDADASDRGERR